MNKIKTVIDTNVFISGIFWKGASYKVLDLWRNKVLINFSTLSIINEIANTLRDFRIKMPEDDIYSLCSLIIENSIILEEDILLNYPVRDIDDNKFIQCAILGKVDYIITQDKDLLSLNEIGEIKILTPNKLLKNISNIP